MQRCCHLGAAVLAAGMLILSGCASAPGPDRGGPGNASAGGGGAEVDSKIVAAHAHYALGMMYDVDDQPDAALEEFSQAADEDPSNEELVLELSRRYLQQKQPERALGLLRKASAVPGASGEIFARLALVCSREGLEAEAIAAGEAAIKRAPLLLAGYQNLFVIHLQKGRGPEALAVLERAARLADAPAEFLIDLADMYSTLERQAPSQKDAARAGARAVLERAKELKPAGARQQLRLADGFNLAGDLTNATQAYLELLRKPENTAEVIADVREKLAELYRQENAPDKAMEQLEAIVREDPSNAEAYYDLGSLAYEAKKLPEAEDDFTKSLLLSDDRPVVYYDLAEVQINEDHTKPALETLQRARSKFGASYVGEFLAGLAYSRDKNFAEAVNHYTSAELLAKDTQPNPLNKYFYFQAGSAYERKGDYEQAEKNFESALKLAPDFADALNYYGYMLADRGEKLERAREMIEQAVKLEPGNAAYLDSLAWVLYKLKRPGEALPHQLKAIALSEEPDATLFDHLGDIYAALNEGAKAREAWQKAVAVEPSEAIQKKLGAADSH